MTSGGRVKCWGVQPGSTSETTYSTIPVDVSGLSSGVTAITAGWFYSCAVSSGGAAKCWGINIFGELGNGTTGNSLVPVDVSGLSSGVTAITARFGHTCALMSTGGAKCWGLNDSGQLGNGTTTNSSTPVDVVF